MILAIGKWLLESYFYLIKQNIKKEKDYSDNREGIQEGTQFASQNTWEALTLVAPGNEGLNSDRLTGTLFEPAGSPIYHLMKTMDSTMIKAGRKS